MSPPISTFIKCVNVALSNRHSGENSAQDLQRAVDKFVADTGGPWEYQAEYDALKHLPKWHLDKIGIQVAADLRAGAEQNTPTEERLRRRAAESPTVENTD